jgi:hypothetical protein
MSSGKIFNETSNTLENNAETTNVDNNRTSLLSDSKNVQPERTLSQILGSQKTDGVNFFKILIKKFTLEQILQLV